MEPNHKKTLKAISLEFRHLLEGQWKDEAWQPGDLERELNKIGVWREENREPKPIEELPSLNKQQRKAREIIDAFLEYRAEANITRTQAVEEFVRESAYTWTNRLLALRCMEARGIIDEVILQKEVYGSRSLEHRRFADAHPERCIKEDGGIFEMLFEQFTERAKELPRLFNPEAPAVAIRPSIPAIKHCIALLSGIETVGSNDPATDEIFEAPDALGWAYQHWNIEEKDRVFEKVRTKKGTKIEGADIIPVTCLYTEDYMVKFLVQNSLGATWMCMHPDSTIYNNWEYYVKDADRQPMKKKSIKNITFLDPAVGSGHFLIEAFDLYYDMYKEEDPSLEPDKICSSILNRNLFGIDIDERAVQISTVVLWMKAKERAPELTSRKLKIFNNHLVSANIQLPDSKNHLRIFLEKHPEDEPLKSAIEIVLNGLENVNELGSLVKIEGPVEKELQKLKKEFETVVTEGYQSKLFGPTEIQGKLPIGVESYFDWKENVLTRLREHFSAEARVADNKEVFFSFDANSGLNLFNVLSKVYDVIATNPPYMGSTNMGNSLKNYVVKYYNEGKRDLFASFIMLCNELLMVGTGRLGIITQQSWMFLKSYINLRYNDKSQLDIQKENKETKGLIVDTSIETLGHLGSKSFQEIGGEVVSVVLLTLKKEVPIKSHHLIAFRLNNLPNPEIKRDHLKRKMNSYKVLQSRHITIPGSPLIYWFSDKLYEMIYRLQCLDDYCYVKQGLRTANNKRYLRYEWESPRNNNIYRWYPYVKGGTFQRWFGLEIYRCDWQNNGIRIKSKINPISNKPYSNIWMLSDTADKFFLKTGITFSYMAQGSIGCRFMEKSIFDGASIAIFPKRNDISLSGLLAVINSIPSTYILRSYTQSLVFDVGYTLKLPIPPDFHKYETLGRQLIEQKKQFISSNQILERNYLIRSQNHKSFTALISSRILNKLECEIRIILLQSIIDTEAISFFNENNEFINDIIDEMGKPISSFGLLRGYDNFDDLGFFQTIHNRNSHTNRNYSSKSESKITIIKNEIQKNFLNNESKYGKKKANEQFKDEEVQQNFLPIPKESIIEYISESYNIHPISAYNLVKEILQLKNSHWVSEECNIVSDFITTFILRLLSYRWPKQIEAGEPIPDWAEEGGIIPLSKGQGWKTLQEIVRERLLAEFKGGDIRSLESEFEEIMGKPLNDWLKRDFFAHHIRQFKKRPIAWHVQSSKPSGGRGSRKREPAFSCFIFYHKLDRDFLPRLRSENVGTLIRRYETELDTIDRAGFGDLLSSEQETRKAQLNQKIAELKDFDEKLIQLQEEGFSSPELGSILEKEQIDKWTSRDGEVNQPQDQEAFLHQEQGYDPDINDGVRVNIAPWQRLGLLSKDVLVKKDVKKAIADRAEWRADERKWCREGKLPQPGWWPTAENEEENG